MEKHFWHKVISNTKISHLPPSRWGHNCCVIGEEVVFFGGYAGTSICNARFELHEWRLELQHCQYGVEFGQNSGNHPLSSIQFLHELRFT